MEKQAEIKREKEVNSACDTILSSGLLQKPNPSRKLQLIASAVVKVLLAVAATAITQLPTGGPGSCKISVSYKN